MRNPAATRVRTAKLADRGAHHTLAGASWRRGVVLLAVVLAHGRTSVAQAHPYGDRFTAQHLEIDVAPDGVELRLTADVPDALLAYMAPGASDPVGTVLDRLDHGVVVVVDGERVGLTSLGRTARLDLVSGTDHVLVAAWHADVDLHGRHALRVTNGNLGDQPSYFRDDVRLPAGSRLHATNLVTARRGREVALHDAWAPLEGLRRVDLDLEIPYGPVHRVFRAASPAWTIPAARTAPGSAWRTGRTDPLTIALAAIGAAAAGFGASLVAHAAPGSRGLPVAGAAAVLVALLFGGTAAAAPLAVPMAVAAWLATLGPDLGRATPVLAAPWAAAAVDGPWASLPVAAWLLAAAAAVPVRDRAGLGAALLALTAVLAATRGG